MNKEKLIKLVSIVSGAILIGVIILFLIDKDWSNAFVFSFVFLSSRVFINVDLLLFNLSVYIF